MFEEKTELFMFTVHAVNLALWLDKPHVCHTPSTNGGEATRKIFTLYASRDASRQKAQCVSGIKSFVIKKQRPPRSRGETFC